VSITEFNWIMWILVGVLQEGLALGGPRDDKHVPLTNVYREFRFDPLGQYIAVPFFFWLMWHFILRPRTWAAFTGYDILAILLGIFWARFGWR